ncbi:hypothetical protein GPALN_012115 [Globodera pallida]|nr:hypothetical protein GPALN_012115 [Globodera pallida]
MDVGAQQEVCSNCFAITPLRGADTETQLACDHLMQSAFYSTTSSNTVEDVGQINQCPSNVNPVMEQFLASNDASVPVAIPTEPTQLPDGRGWIGFCKPDSIPTQCWSKKHLNLAWRNLPNKWKGSKNFIGNEEQTTVYEGLVASTSTSDGASKQAKLDDLRAVKYRCRPDCRECKYMHFC